MSPSSTSDELAASGVIRLDPTARIVGAKVFSAGTSIDANALGDRITEWLLSDPDRSAVEFFVTQSGACLSITIWYAR